MKEPETQKLAMQFEKAIRKLKRPDKFGVVGRFLGTGSGAAGGAAAASALASAAGVTTLLGSTTLANVLGGVLVTTTPVGWVVGCGIAGGLAGYGIAKLIKSGGKQDHIRQEIIKGLQKKLDALQSNEAKQCNRGDLKTALSDALKNNLISDEQAERLVKLVAGRKLNDRVVLERLLAINGACAVAASK